MYDIKDIKKDTPVNGDLVIKSINKMNLENMDNASIREIVTVVNLIEEQWPEKFVRMEMGIPGLPPSSIGINGQIKALKQGVASLYPPIDGVKPLKKEASDFINLFMNVKVSPEGCIPTVGSMEGTYSAFLAACNLGGGKDTILFIDPGFPVQKQQMQVMGGKYESFDVFHYRGEKLKEKLESYLKKGNISAIVYSNPNNPSWICFTEEELKIIGDLSMKYDVIIFEDLAYFAMDFRKNLYTPGKAPYQATVANYTNRYFLFISGSKIFSYAGERIAVMAISDFIFNREYPNLETRFSCKTFGHTIVYKILYALSSGTSHSAQLALAAMLKAANDGDFNFVNDIRDYENKAKIMKKLFTENGFKIVYQMDGDTPVGNGFYFTVYYPGMTGGQLLFNLLCYGISAITLKNTGSEKQGLRICVSHVDYNQFEDLEKRLKKFNTDFSEKL